MIQDRICGRQAGDSDEYLIEYLIGRQADLSEYLIKYLIDR